MTFMVIVGVLGACAAYAATSTPLALDRKPPQPPTRCALALTAALVGAVAAWRLQVPHAWWWTPMLAAWVATLITAAFSDARWQRIPTALMRTGGLIVAIAAIVGAIGTNDDRFALKTVAITSTVGLACAAAWRWADLGFGDVRLGIVIGLGLGHASTRGLVIAAWTFAAIIAIQGIWAYARTRSTKTHVPMAPAMVAAALVAVIA